MKRVIINSLAMIALGYLLLTPQTTKVRASALFEDEESAGAVVCSPDVYFQPPEDCLPLGPSGYLTEMARLGIPFPLQPLLAISPDPALNDLPYRYYKVNPTGTELYPSLEAAINKQGANRTIPRGRTIYVVYSQVVDTGKGIYYQLPSGEWMPGGGSRVSVPVFQGLEFQSTPRNGFGWVLSDVEVKGQPDFLQSNKPIRSLTRFNIVQIYSVRNIEKSEWYLIGPDEWVEARLVAAVFPNTTPPDGVTNGRWIDVNLAEQTLTVYDNRQLVFATIVSTGIEPFWTRPGLFPIYKKKALENMSGSFEADRSDYYYLENVPWTMYFDKARALHGTYWHKFYGYPLSHGCVNLSAGDSHWIFNWAKEGDWVYIHDPSGATPTDPAKYGEGGA
jgi:lipoprotein-anchoring transpeptidase ErfK/SrfK